MRQGRCRRRRRGSGSFASPKGQGTPSASDRRGRRARRARRPKAAPLRARTAPFRQRRRYLAVSSIGQRNTYLEVRDVERWR